MSTEANCFQAVFRFSFHDVGMSMREEEKGGACYTLCKKKWEVCSFSENADNENKIHFGKDVLFSSAEYLHTKLDYTSQRAEQSTCIFQMQTLLFSELVTLIFNRLWCVHDACQHGKSPWTLVCVWLAHILIVVLSRFTVIADKYGKSEHHLNLPHIFFSLCASDLFISFT